MFKKEKGFTLIELMIVVAIIGILAAVAIPRFADMISKAKEGATKGNLGAMRSALSIYYGDQEGKYPLTLANLVPNYLDEIRDCNTKEHGKVSTVTPYYSLSSATGTVTTDDGSWAYYRDTATGITTLPNKAGVFVECTNTTHTTDASVAATW